MTYKRVRRIVLLALAAGLAVVLVAVRNSDNANTQTGAADPPQHPPSAVPSEAPASATPTPAPGKRSPVSSPSTRAPRKSTPPPAPPHGQHRRPAEIPIRTAATNYLRVFFDRRIPTEQWRTRLAALSTKSHAGTIATIPRVAVPNVSLISTGVTRMSSSTATVSAVLSDRSVLTVGLVLDERGWKVSRVVPQRKVVAR